jgi:nucleoside-triphosphatase THEP1
LDKDHTKIKEADPVEIGRPKFVAHVEKVLTKGKKGVIVTWNGKSCDME